MSVVGAYAADLPVAKAAPVEYVRVCSTYGAGFFYIPGTDTCLRVSGRVRAQYIYVEPLTRASDATGFYTRGRIQLDARTATAYGLLRSVVRFEITRTSGAFGPAGSIGQTPNVAEAFVQFGGLTAGRVVSFFSNSDLPTGHFGTLRFDDAPDVDLLAYTFTFGNGFSATLSVENPLDRRYNNAFVGGAAIPFVSAGTRVPDIIGNVKYTGTWGTVQLSGALHQLRSNNLFTTTAFAGFADYPDTEYGYAIALQGSVNLPALGVGDAIWYSAQYSDGALGYLSGGNSSITASPASSLAAAGLLGFTDAYINPVNGDVERGRGWSLAGGLRHYWTPQLRSNLFGSYLNINYEGPSSTLSAAGYQTGLLDYKEYRIGTNLIWQPVSGLDLGVEAIYVRLDPKGRVLVPGLNGGSFGDTNAWEGRLRVQRDF